VAVSTPNAAIATTKYVAWSSAKVYALPAIVTAKSVVPLPRSPVKITRNINGNANVKKAEAGFRQKARFVYFTCRSASFAVLIP
jgi:hypothetical protein